MATDWFRKTTWTIADAQDFEAHLKRSRGTYHKSQYLRIQASHLQAAHPPLYAAALQLLERVLGEHRDESQVASALFQKAECLVETLGFNAALPIFRETLTFERSNPSWRTNAWIVFPWWIVKEHRVDLYDEALEAISHGASSAPFPVDQFRMSVVLAIVKDEKRDNALARSFAKDAYEAAARTHSGFQYHTDVGLVDGVEPWAKAQLDRILRA